MGFVIYLQFGDFGLQSLQKGSLTLNQVFASIFIKNKKNIHIIKLPVRSSMWVESSIWGRKLIGSDPTMRKKLVLLF